MQLHRYRIGSKLQLAPSVITIGNFDGLHLGHQQVISTVVARAKEVNLVSVVVLFEPQPLEFLQGQNTPARLTRLREKITLLMQTEIDHVVVIAFNQVLALMRAQEFIRDILVSQLQTKHVIIGDDFHFGYQREGDIQLLQTQGKALGFKVESYPEFKIDGLRVSSSRIRQALADNNLQLTERLLGRKYSLSGRVAHGHKRGRTIGFPTANIFLHRDKSPVLGVYAVQMRGVDMRPLNGVANIGSRPTVDGTRILLEVFLFDFNRDIYGYHVEVDILHKLRAEKRYDSFDELKVQIFKDVAEAKDFFY